MVTICSKSRCWRLRVRSGTSLLEILVSAALLASLLVIINQSLVGLRRQSRLVDRRFVAQQVLENALEVYCQQPWDALSTETVQQIKLPEFAVAKLPQCRIWGEVVEETDPVVAKRVILRLAWGGHPEQAAHAIALSAWSFPAEDNEQ